MSRLDVFIGRMVSQRACLEFAAAKTADLLGPVFELGLGNGRTYHHLREIMPEREIYVFERAFASYPDSSRPNEQLVMGDLFETLTAALDRFGTSASLVHADLGGHNAAKNGVFARRVSPLTEPILVPGGLMISSDRMCFEELT